MYFCAPFHFFFELVKNKKINSIDRTEYNINTKLKSTLKSLTNFLMCFLYAINTK